MEKLETRNLFKMNPALQVKCSSERPFRSMSCNLLEVRSRQIGVRDWATSSSNSYDSLSRPSSLEAVEVGS